MQDLLRYIPALLLEVVQFKGMAQVGRPGVDARKVGIFLHSKE